MPTPDPSQPEGHFKAEASDWAVLGHTEGGRRIVRELEEHFDALSPLFKAHVILKDPAAAELLAKIKAGNLEVINYIKTQAKPPTYAHSIDA
tara:strand:+ start:2348 stop:2623 length:276 start_codon:yes stop_codon:yes gene_type:complete